MITEQTIREAYIHLRKTNNSVPDETLDFMREASLDKLNGKGDKEHLIKFMRWMAENDKKPYENYEIVVNEYLNK